MPDPKPPTRIPLPLVHLACVVCGTEATALEVNRDKVRFHTKDGAMVRFSRAGLTEPEIARLRATPLCCECCKEEQEEQDESGRD